MTSGARGCPASGAVLGRAYELGDRPALIEIGGGGVLGGRTLATTVVRAASGLLRCGVFPGYTAGVYVDTVTAHLLATWPVLAAGGTAATLPAAAPAEWLTRRLTRCDARMLITTPRLAATALRLADRSRVRRVVVIGSDPVPETCAYAELLTGPGEPAVPGPGSVPLRDPAAHPALLTVEGPLSRAELVAGGPASGFALGELGEKDVLLATWPLDGGAAVTALLTAALTRGTLIVAAPGLPAAKLPGALHDHGVTVAALTEPIPAEHSRPGLRTLLRPR
ncbi:AMP-binding protein [Rhizohabitans arisaemae]|uniref:AMP-binding protein n=1 Tax=Rhizohabitans arisaemae TaxID=2720610 RepID=UPI0024B0B8B0|nr:AMP-binding protein [Rhizohabitans arisaemae]